MQAEIDFEIPPRAAWPYVSAALVLLLYALVGWGAYRFSAMRLELRPEPQLPLWNQSHGVQVLTMAGRVLVAQLASYDDELFAYLMYQHFHQAAGAMGDDVYLTYRRLEGGGVQYSIEAVLPNDLLSAPDAVRELERRGAAASTWWRFVAPEALREFQGRTRVLVSAYNLPTRRELESLSTAELQAYIERFVRFKSVTDARVREGIGPVPRALSPQQARTLAGDIVKVAAFYALPLDAFLGIGAMENNYMDVPGDLENAAWKRRPDKGDVVLKRSRGRVLVLNPSAGIWQITRETLRYAHKLFLADTRDYSTLPPRLRPPAELNPDATPPEVLTTYAGLLFRDLIDRFHGDVQRAAAGYNGGFRNPNFRYAAGVQQVADHARVVVERAAVLGGRSAAGMQFMCTR